MRFREKIINFSEQKKKANLMSVKKAKKRPAEDEAPDPEQHQGVRYHLRSSEDPVDVLKAWDGTNWCAAQKKNGAGVDERVGVDKEDTEVWRGWRHTCKVGAWCVPVQGSLTGELVELPGFARTVGRTVRCPHCETDMAFSSSTTVMRHHIRPESVYPSVACAKKPAVVVPAQVGATAVRTTSQPDAVLQQREPRHQDLSDLAVRFLAVLALPFNFFVHPIVKLFLLAYRTSHQALSGDRTTMRDSTIHTADADSADVLRSLNGCSVTIAVDGGTLQGRKLFGIGLGAGGRGYFWKLHTVLRQNNLSVSKRLRMTLAQLAAAVVWVVCVVGDNHSGLQLGLRKVAAERAFLVLRCACHSLQLLVKDIIKVFRDFVEARHIHDYIVQQLTPAIAASLPRKLVKFCETRWSTEHDALSSMFDMRHEISAAFPAAFPEEGNSGATKWMSVKRACDGLQQFKVATKILEADTATLMDVVCVLVGLLISLSAAGGDQQWYDSLVSRITKNFSSQALVVVLFAIPGFLGHLVDKDMGEVAQSFVNIVVRTGALAIFHREQAAFAAKGLPFFKTLAEITSTLQALANKWVQYSKIPNHDQASWSSQGLLAFWARLTLTFGWLAEYIIAVISCLPSEAIVERIFSHSKLILDATRTRMHERPTESQTFLKFNGAWKFGKKVLSSQNSSSQREEGIAEELKSIPTNWYMLVMLATHVHTGLLQDPTRGDVAGTWKVMDSPDLDDEDTEEEEECDTEEDDM